jgi:Putative lumazine-binding
MTTSNIHDILSTVQTYLDGLYEGDIAKLKHAFHEVAHLHSVTEGKLNNLPLADWLKLVEGRVSPQKQNFHRKLERIITINESAPGCANVTLNCAAPGRLFTDHLSLVKADGRWQIVNKQFFGEPIV